MIPYNISRRLTIDERNDLQEYINSLLAQGASHYPPNAIGNDEQHSLPMDSETHSSAQESAPEDAAEHPSHAPSTQDYRILFYVLFAVACMFAFLAVINCTNHPTQPLLY